MNNTGESAKKFGVTSLLFASGVALDCLAHATTTLPHDATLLGLSPHVFGGVLTIGSHVVAHGVFEGWQRTKEHFRKDLNSDLESVINTAYDETFQAIRNEIINEYNLQENKKDWLFRCFLSKENENHLAVEELDSDFLSPLKDYLKNNDNIEKMLLENQQLKPDEYLLKAISSVTPSYFNSDNEVIKKFTQSILEKFKRSYRHHFLQNLKPNEKAKTAYYTHLLESILGNTEKIFDTTEEINKGLQLLIDFSSEAKINFVEISTELRRQGFYIIEIKDKLIEVIKQKEDKEQILIQQLGVIQNLLVSEKAEKDKQRESFLKQEDNYKQELSELKEQIASILQTNNPQDTPLKAKLEEQIKQNEIAQRKLQELSSVNESEIKAIQNKYVSQIGILQKQIDELQIELNLQKDSQKLLNTISANAISEVEKLIASNNLDDVISYSINNPSFTVRDTAYILLLKANVLANQFKIAEAEECFVKSISIFEFDKNLSAYSKFLFVKKDWAKCLDISKRGLEKNTDLNDKLSLTNRLLEILLIENRNSEAITIGNDLINNNDISGCEKNSQINFYLTIGNHYSNNCDLADARISFEKVIEIVSLNKTEELQQFSLTAHLLLGDTYFDYRLFVKSDKEEDLVTANQHYENAKSILLSIKDKKSLFYKLSALKVLVRLGIIQKSKGEKDATEKFLVSSDYGNQILKDYNELHLEFVKDNLELHIHYLNENSLKAKLYYSFLFGYKNITETKSDLSSQQNLFYINTWLFALNWINSKSSLSDYFLETVVLSFEKCASKSCSEFIQNGIQFLKVATGYYQTFDAEHAIPYYRKLIHWLCVLNERKPFAFTTQLCDAYINMANTYVTIGNSKEALASYDKAKTILDDIILDQYVTFSLQARIKSGIIAVEMNAGEIESALSKLKELANNIEKHNFKDNFEEQEKKCELLFLTARQYQYCNSSQRALEIYKTCNIN